MKTFLLILCLCGTGIAHADQSVYDQEVEARHGAEALKAYQEQQIQEAEFRYNRKHSSGSSTTSFDVAFFFIKWGFIIGVAVILVKIKEASEKEAKGISQNRTPVSDEERRRRNAAQNDPFGDYRKKGETTKPSSLGLSQQKKRPDPRRMGLWTPPEKKP